MSTVSRNHSSLLFQALIMYSGANDGRDFVLGRGNLLITEDEAESK